MLLVQVFRLLAFSLLVGLSTHSDAEVLVDLDWQYDWQSPEGESHRLALRIPSALLERGFLGQGDLLNEKIIGKRIVQSVKAYADSLSDHLVSVTVLGDSLQNFQIKTARRGGNSELATQRRALVNDFLQREIHLISANSYYRYDPGMHAIVLEYNAVIRDYQSLILDTITQLASLKGVTTEDDLRRVLVDMLQSIPYISLTDADFPLYNPVRMLVEKQGDCESKQLFLAAGLKILYPQDSIYLVLLPKQEHIVLMQRDANGNVLYMDATGPARKPPGAPLTHSLDEGILYEVSL